MHSPAGSCGSSLNGDEDKGWLGRGGRRYCRRQGDSSHNGKCWNSWTGAGWKGLEGNRRFPGRTHLSLVSDSDCHNKIYLEKVSVLSLNLSENPMIYLSWSQQRVFSLYSSASYSKRSIRLFVCAAYSHKINFWCPLGIQHGWNAFFKTIFTALILVLWQKKYNLPCAVIFRNYFLGPRHNFSNKKIRFLALLFFTFFFQSFLSGLFYRFPSQLKYVKGK